MNEIKERLRQFEEARAKGLPASTINGCGCDFCTGKKKLEDNWCAYCGEVQLGPDKSWENEDVCDGCAEILKQRAEGVRT